MRISLLASEDSLLSLSVFPYELFDKANFINRYEKPDADPIFELEYLGMTHKTVYGGRSTSFQCDRTLAEVDQTDVILVPALEQPFDVTIPKNRAFADFIREQHQKGALIVGLCAGAALLAEAGLLDGKEATTHWAVVDQLQSRYPKVNFVIGPPFTRAERLYTSSGSLSAVQLLIHLLERFTDRRLAITVSKFFLTPYNQGSPQYYAMFMPYKAHKDGQILRAQEFIEARYQEGISIESAAEHAGLGVRNFIKRFKKSTRCTPIEYLQRVRIEMAKRALEQGSVQVSEAMYEVGYQDHKSFRNLFRRYTGVTPSEYRQKYTALD